MSFTPVTTVIVPALSQSLTDLSTAKSELGVTSNADDAWLTRAIGQASGAIATYTQRTFAPELVQDRFAADQTRQRVDVVRSDSPLQLARWPVVTVVSLTQTLSTGTTQTLIENTDFQVNYKTGELTRLDPVTGANAVWENLPTSVRYVGGYGTEVVEAAPVPGTGPYQITVSQAAAFSCDMGAAFTGGAALSRVSGAPTAGQYAAVAGVFTFAAADAGKSVTLSYAVAAVPSDLVACCLQLVSERWWSRGRDPSMVQRETPGVGIERWWFGNAPGQSGPFPPSIDAALIPYRAPVVA